MRRQKIWVDHEARLHATGVEESQWGHFEVYKTESELLADVNNPELFNVWDSFPNAEFPERLSPRLLHSRQSQRRYEVYIGGFLMYHDEKFKQYSKGKGYTDEKGYPEVKTYPNWKEYVAAKKAKNEAIYDPGEEYFKHVIYFDWNAKKGTVTIYINITPDEYNTDPPKPPAPPPPES